MNERGGDLHGVGWDIGLGIGRWLFRFWWAWAVCYSIWQAWLLGVLVELAYAFVLLFWCHHYCSCPLFFMSVSESVLQWCGVVWCLVVVCVVKHTTHALPALLHLPRALGVSFIRWLGGLSIKITRSIIQLRFGHCFDVVHRVRYIHTYRFGEGRIHAVHKTRCVLRFPAAGPILVVCHALSIVLFCYFWMHPSVQR